MSRYSSNGGEKVVKTNGDHVNVADGYNADGSQNTRTVGSNVSDYGAVTPSDTVDLTKKAIAIAVAGGAGNVAVVKPNGAEVIIPAVLLPVGQFIPFSATRIKATGTTATTIWVMYE